MDSLGLEMENLDVCQSKLNEFNENISKSYKNCINEDYLRYSKFRENTYTKTYSWPLDNNGIRNEPFFRLSYSPCGLYLSASLDTKIRVWNIMKKSLETTLIGHYERISCLGYSPDGLILASGSKDATLRLWNMQELKLISTLTGHSGGITCLSFILKGSHLASGSIDKTIKIWSHQEKTLKFTLSDHSNQLITLSSSANGEFLASASINEIYIWDLGHSRQPSILTQGCSEVSAICYSPDSKTLAVGSRSSIKLINIDDKKTGVYIDRYLNVTCLSFSMDGKYLIAGSKFKCVYVFNAFTGEKKFDLGSHDRRVTCLAVCPSGKYFATGSKDKSVKIWDIKDMKESFHFGGKFERIRILVYSDDGKTIAFGSGNQRIGFWDVDRKQERLFKVFPAYVDCLAFSPDGQCVAVGSQEQDYFMIWNIKNQEECLLEGRTSGVYSLAYSKFRSLLAVGTGEGTVRVYDPQSKTEAFSMRSLSSPVSFLSFCPNDKYLASGSRDQIIHIWNLHENKPQLIIENISSWMSGMLFTPDSAFLVIPVKKSIKVWNLQEDKKEFSLKAETEKNSCYSLSPDGKLLASCSGEENLSIFDLISKKELFSFNLSYKVLTLSFSPKQDFLALGTTSSNIVIWDMRQKQQEFTFNVSSFKYYRVNSYSFSENGQFLAAADRYESYKIWNLTENQEFELEQRESESIHHLVFSPDGSFLAADHGNEGIYVWNIFQNKVEFKLEKTDRAQSIFYSPDGKMLAMVTNKSKVKIWDLQEKVEKICFDEFEGRITGYTFSHDSNFFAIACEKNGLKIWNLQLAKEEKVFYSDLCEVYCLRYSSDGRYLAASVSLKGIIIWDLEQKVEMFFIPCRFSCPVSISFSPDSRFLASGYSNGIAILWNIAKNREEFSFKYHYHKSNILDVVFNSDMSSLFTWDNFQCQKLNLKNKLCYIHNENLKNFAKQSCDLESIYQSIKTSFDIHSFYPEFEDSKIALEKKIHKIISSMVIEWNFTKNIEIIRKVSKYCVIFAQFGINLKYLSLKAFRHLDKIDSKDLERIIDGHFDYLIIDHAINSTSDLNERKTLIRYKETLKIINLSTQHDKKLQASSIQRRAIHTQGISDLKCIKSIVLEDFEIHYYAGYYYFQRILIKKYILGKYLSKQRKVFIRSAVEREALHLENLGKLENGSKCFCKFMGLLKDKASFSLVMKNDGTILSDFIKSLKNHGIRKPNIKIENSVFSLIEMIVVLQGANIFMTRFDLQSFVIDENYTVKIFDLENFYVKNNQGVIFEVISLQNESLTVEKSHSIYDEELEKENVYTVGTIILQLALQRKIRVFEGKIDYFLSRIRKSGFSRLEKFLKNMLCSSANNRMTFKELAALIEQDKAIEEI